MTLAQVQAQAQSLGLDRLDAQLLLLHVLGQPDSARGWLLAHDTEAAPESVQRAYLQLARRRANGEPVAYLTGQKEFFGLMLQVDARVLVPRPDTETLVEWALEVLEVPDAGTDVPEARVLDLGTGSGAIALALKAQRPRWQVSAVDASADALAVAEANAARLQLAVTFSQGHWLSGTTGCFHAIVSNPPYIEDHDPHLAALVHEPRQALTSGADGLDDLRAIVTQAPAHLLPGGWLLLEHGYNQAEAVRALLTQAGFGAVGSRRDLSGTERCSGGQLVTAHPNAHSRAGGAGAPSVK